MSYFDQYAPIAAQAANQYGVPQDIFFGLIQQESSWNPNATPGTSSAFGFTQLLKGTAAQLGVDAHDPVQNLFGGAKYLASMPGSSWTEKLAHYYNGPAKIASEGLAYASSVLDKAKKFMNSPLGHAAETAGLAAATGGTSLIGGVGGLGSVVGGSGSSWIDDLKSWIASSGFFQRLALALVALILILGAVYTLKGKAT